MQLHSFNFSASGISSLILQNFLFSNSDLATISLALLISILVNLSIIKLLKSFTSKNYLFYNNNFCNAEKN